MNRDGPTAWWSERNAETPDYIFTLMSDCHDDFEPRQLSPHHRGSSFLPLYHSPHALAYWQSLHSQDLHGTNTRASMPASTALAILANRRRWAAVRMV